MAILGLIPKHLSYLCLMIALSLIPDWDFFLSRQHRETFTHTVIFWMVITLIIITIRSEFWIVAPPIFSHLFLDSIDWGVMILPFYREKFGFKVLRQERDREKYGFSKSIEIYLSNRKMLYLEGALLLTSIVMLAGAAYCS